MGINHIYLVLTLFLKVSITPEIIHFMCLFCFFFVTYTQRKTSVAALDHPEESAHYVSLVPQHRVYFTIDATLTGVHMCVFALTCLLQKHVYTLAALIKL